MIGISQSVPRTAHTGSSWIRVMALAACFLCVPPAITPSVAGSDACVGDCDGSRRTTVDELVRLVNLALSGAAVAACTAGDVDGNQRITVEELVSGVRSSLEGCAALPPSVDVESLCFSGATGTTPTAQTINIAKASGAWNANANVSWIALAPAQGSAPGMTRVTVDPSGLGEGMHEAAVTIADDSGSSTRVDVVFNVAGQGMSPGWTIQTVAPIISPGQSQESVGSPAQSTTLALRPDGTPGITFYRNDVLVDRTLQLAQFTGCTWQTESIEKRGIDASLAFDAAGRPHVSYQRTGILRYAHKPDATWQMETVEAQEPKGDTGHRGSIAIDSAGHPHISYLLKFLPNNVFTYDLHYAVRGGDGWSIDTPDAEGTTGWDTSLALSQSGDDPSITYFSNATSSLHYAERRDGAWVNEVIIANARPAVLRLDAAGRPRVGVHDPTIASALFAYRDDGSWSVERVDQQGASPRGSARVCVALALDAAGVPHLAYPDFQTQTMKYATRTAPDTWTVQTIDQGPDKGDFCSLQIDRQGTAHISYLDLTNGVLKYARGPSQP